MTKKRRTDGFQKRGRKEKKGRKRRKNDEGVSIEREREILWRGTKSNKMMIEKKRWGLSRKKRIKYSTCSWIGRKRKERKKERR